MNQLEQQIKNLEEKLLALDASSAAECFEELISEEFEEMKGCGNVVNKAEVIEWLKHKGNEERWLLTDFKVKKLSSSVALATYHANKMNIKGDSISESLRSSIWKYQDNLWKIIFHQGTKIDSKGSAPRK